MKLKSSIVFERIFICICILLLSGIIGCAKKGPSPTTVSWSKTGGIATSGKYRFVLVTDLNNDTHLDIAGASSDPGKLGLWYGDGSGNMALPQFLPEGQKVDARCVAAGDFNGDGRKDLVISAQREFSGIYVAMNQPGQKWERGIEPTKINNYEGIRVDDVNQDGHLDIIAANTTSDNEGGIQVWLGDGKGGWTIESGPTDIGKYMDVEVADFNKDGRPDIAGAAWGAHGAVRVWLGDGTGNWSSTPPLQIGNFNGLSFCDINNDLNVDILAGSYRNGIHIFLGDGKGGFEPKQSPVDTGSYWRAITNDIDEDGVMDIIAGSVDGKGIRAWLNLDKNRWKEVEDKFPTLGNYYDFKMADLDRDGKNEMIIAGFGEGIKIISGKTWPYAQSLQNLKDAGSDSKESDQVAGNSVFTNKNGYVEYKVGPGDTLAIILWEPDKITKQEVEIMPDGKLSFSFVEDLYVNEMTLKELDAVLTDELSVYIKKPQISVRVRYCHSKWASMMGPGRGGHGGGSGGWSGEYGKRGGRYYLDGKVTLIELLSGAGIARDANLREILVTRKNGRTLKLNVYKAMTLGDKTQDIIMDDGDSVYVSLISKEGNRVFVFGEVAQPGAYAFFGSDMPLIDAIAAAGGPTVFGLLDHVKIIRGDITKPEVISVDLSQLILTGDQTQNMALADGDLVYVPRTVIGDIGLFVKRMRPFFTLILSPLQAYEEIDDFND